MVRREGYNLFGSIVLENISREGILGSVCLKINGEQFFTAVIRVIFPYIEIRPTSDIISIF
jgi:hypothetical protein